MTLRIIGTGLSRTGTMSLKDALEILTGEPCYHMYELFLNPERLHLWEEAEEKQHTDWDSLFNGYGSAVDLPTAKYYAQLLEQYPDAKFVHTERDSESWYESAVGTIFSPTSPIIDELKVIFESMDKSTNWNRLRAIRFSRLSVSEELFRGQAMDESSAIDIYNEHNKNVKAVIPSENLLVFRLEDGWEPLCDFLNLEVPQKTFPHNNKRDSFAESMIRMCHMT
jgi:hypothetical protein